MRRIILFLLIITPLLNFSQKSQNGNFTIKGKIVDSETKKPIEDASIIFKNIVTNATDYGVLTNSKGAFNLNIEKRIYTLYISFIGYKSKYLNISDISKNLNIGTIELEVKTNFLEEIEIIGSKKAIQIKPNKIIFHVEEDIASSSGAATDILNHIPSVSVDPSGNITVQGQGHVQVMINGKTSSLTKMNALKSLPAGSIEDIEVITNPGAKYKGDALSIINIILKKGKNLGLNASITTTAGQKDYYGSLITLNNKTDKLNFYTNLSYNHSNPINQADSKNEYFQENNTAAFLNEHSLFNSKNDAFYGTIGCDFYISNKTILSTSINFQNIHNLRNSLTKSEIFDGNLNPLSINKRNFDSEFNNELIEFSLDFEHQFNDKGKKVSASYVYTDDLDQFDNSINNSNNSYSNIDYLEKNKLKNKIIDFNFLSPIGKNGSYSIGYYGEFGNIPFKQIYETGNDLKIDYSEKINAGYIEYEYENKKFYAGIGLRGEFSEIKVDYIDSSRNQKNNFDNFLPSVYLQYNINEVQNFSLSYNEAILRPALDNLLPFEEKYSETSSYRGNPNLTPVFVDQYNLSFTSSGLKFTISPSLKYQQYNNYRQEIIYETGEVYNGVNKLIRTPVNIGIFKLYGLNLNAIYKPNKNLYFSSNIYIYNFDQSGFFEITNSVDKLILLDYNNSSINGSVSLLTQIKIHNLFDFQINAKHFLKSEGAYSTRKAYTYASVAFNKDILNKDASISLTVNDLFLSNKTDRDRFDTGYFSKSLIQNKYRNILLSFTYRFNQSKKDRMIDFERKLNKPNY